MSQKTIFYLVVIVAIASITQTARAALFIDSITVPAGGVLVDNGHSFPFSVDYGTTFSSITSIFLIGHVSGDLWDPNEQWYYDFGGQINLDTSSRTAFGLTANNPAELTLLLDGHQDFTFNAIGSMNLVSLEMDIQGTAVPEPASLLVWSLLGLALGGASWWRRWKR